MEHVNCSFNSSCDSDLHRTSDTLDSKQMGLGVFLGLCFLVGLPSNIAVIVTIAQQWKENIRFTVKLMVNLAVSDCLTLGLAPFAIHGLLFGWTLGLWPCRILMGLIYFAMYASVLTITLMAVHSYHTIESKNPNQKELERLQKGRRCLLLIGLWSLAFVFALPIFFTRSVEIKRELPRCQRSIKSLTGKVTFLLLEVILGFVLPFSIILTSYCCIHCRAKSRGGQNIKIQKKRMRRLVISIVMAFFLFWTPVHIINVIDITTTLTETSFPAVYAVLKSFRRATGDLSKTLAVINCCVNPFLYACMHRRSLLKKRDYQQKRKIELNIFNSH